MLTIGLHRARLRRSFPLGHGAGWMFALLVSFASHAAWAQQPAAQPAAPLRLELNRLEPQGQICRVWMVANNGSAEALDPVRLDLVLFGKDGVAARRLAVDIGPLPTNRTVVRLFDVAAQPCDGIGQILMNDVLICGTAEPAARAACSDRAVLVSRIQGVTFDK